MAAAPAEWTPGGADGTPLHGRLVRAPGQRAGMLLSHGFAEHLGRYEELTEALTRAGVTVLSYDHRGHGRSPGRRATVDVEELVRDHLAVRRHARATLGDLPLLLHGHSMGGVVTAASVLRRPRGVTGALLSSPALSVAVPVPAPARIAGRVLARVAPAAGTVHLDAGAISRVPAVVRDYERDPLVFRGRTPARTAVSLMATGQQVLARAARWAVPALVVHGTADELADVAASRRFAAEAGTGRDPRPPVRLVEEPGGYHELYHDRCAPKVLQLTTDWVGELLSR